MIIEQPNPSQVALQATTHNIDGTPKLALASATTRVYHLVGVTETEDLAPTVLSQVGSTNTWRYVWTPTSLAVGQYFVEYTLVDNDGAAFVDFEPLVVKDFAEEASVAALQGDLTDTKADVEFLVQMESGKWEIVNNQMIFYNTSGTEIKRFDLYDINGLLTNGINMYKREPV